MRSPSSSAAAPHYPRHHGQADIAVAPSGTGSARWQRIATLPAIHWSPPIATEPSTTDDYSTQDGSAPLRTSRPQHATLHRCALRRASHALSNRSDALHQPARRTHRHRPQATADHTALANATSGREPRATVLQHLYCTGTARHGLWLAQREQYRSHFHTTRRSPF